MREQDPFRVVNATNFKAEEKLFLDYVLHTTAGFKWAPGTVKLRLTGRSTIWPGDFTLLLLCPSDQPELGCDLRSRCAAPLSWTIWEASEPTLVVH